MSAMKININLQDITEIRVRHIREFDTFATREFTFVDGEQEVSLVVFGKRNNLLMSGSGIVDTGSTEPVKESIIESLAKGWFDDIQK